MVLCSPEGGERGGKLVAEGTPEDVALAPMSYTGDVLARVLARAGRDRPDRLGRPRPTRPTRAAAAKKATARAGAAGRRRKAG